MAGIQWGSVADWVSGIGSLSAAVVALYVALSARRIRLQGYCGERIIVGPGQPKVDVFSISVTNISQRPTVITNIGFTFGIWRRKKHGIITFMPYQYGHGIPNALSDGETGNWNVPLGEDRRWLVDIAKQFSVSRFSVFTWRVQVHTSNGGTTTLRPEKNIRQSLLTCAQQSAKG
ncbi:hypothetical protein ACFQGA_00350 [Marinobacter koreensis]|uniref:DUF58 domain-containing protein n=1 Tax=Marinobacter koreensis TaxID=335974 RepID=A0ABW0RQ05_9GAMM|nr:hypothetical protein [Marinobacter koreensis]MCK7548943.1 hypothetical protein [Marinobacter koreensis]